MNAARLHWLVGLSLLACAEAPAAPAASDHPAPALTPVEPAAPAPAEATPTRAQNQDGVDPTEPFTLTLGRGSGRSGLATVHVPPTGQVVVVQERWDRRPRGIMQRWVRTELTLDEAQRARFVSAVVERGLAGLDALYHEPGVHDGSQWILRVQQGSIDQVVYCDNRFPPELRAFAQDLDALLEDAGLGDADWERLEGPGAMDANQALWDALTASRERAAAAATP